MFNCLEVATGQVIAPSIGQTRTEADFWLIFSRLLLLTQQVFDLHYRSIEYHPESLVRWVTLVCGLNQDLGVKGESGILKSMATRLEFLSDSNHRILLYTQA